MPNRNLIAEYFEVVQSLTADDRAGEQLARNIWRQMTAEQQAEVYSAWTNDGYDGDPVENGLTVTVS